jgi:hypothetical protein
LAEDDSGILEAQYSEESKKIFLHLKAKPGVHFTKEMYRDWLFYFEDILDAMRDRGVTEVYSLIPADEKVLQFNALFGMVPIAELSEERKGRPVFTGWVLERKL